VDSSLIGLAGARTYFYLRKKAKRVMTLKDLQNAVAFLRRLSVGQMEAEELIATVEALEAEIKKRRQKK
jgi:hypothetical protein